MTDWGDLVSASTHRPVWKGSVQASDVPKVTLWWKAWQAVSGGQDVLHVGVTGRGAEAEESLRELVLKLLGGVVDMAWRSVGGTVAFETMPVTWNRESGWTGKVVFRTNDGRLLEPVMTALQRTKEQL